MKIIDLNGVYSYVLNEMEWYGVSEAGRQSTVEGCLEGAKKANARYAAILVKPDAVMSISPVACQHKVWGHTFPLDAELAFEQELSALLRKTVLPHKRKRAILKMYMESHGQ